MILETNTYAVKKRLKMYQSENGRVITKLFIHGSDERIIKVIKKVLTLSEEETALILNSTLNEFSGRHRNFRKILEEHYNQVSRFVPPGVDVSKERKLLIGSYYTSEYSIESAALFNPSIVLHPCQDDLPEGSARFIISFRATGEGHISSIEFRSGIIDENNDIFFDPVSPYVEVPEVLTDKDIDKRLFQLKIKELGVANEATHDILSRLPETFVSDDLYRLVEETQKEGKFIDEANRHSLEMMRWLLISNYTAYFNPRYDISERVIFPVIENERRGIEDARFVRFVDDDGTVTYYAPYTAYSGYWILPQLIETKDFVKFKVVSLNGKAVQNKGMALFPRKINGKYYMLSRQDGENNHIMFSDNIHFWQESQIIQKPTLPWEFVQIGNCGSPIETEKGWIVLIHGVGPMRKYSIGVELLDLNDPTKIIGRLDEPIIVAEGEDREGYVPNVVYTCGAMLHNDELVIPYAIADSRCAMATMSMSRLLENLSYNDYHV